MVPEDHLEFLQAVWTRRPVFTYVFFGLNILIFLLMMFAGGSTNEPTLLAFGVKANSEIAQGQWWRFITPIFIHIGFLHLLFNSYALWIVGPQVEKLYGPARFVILYLLTGVAGVIGSYLYVTGEFTAADGLPAYRIARWDGTSWSGVGGGTSGIVLSVAGLLLVARPIAALQAAGGQGAAAGRWLDSAEAALADAEQSTSGAAASLGAAETATRSAAGLFDQLASAMAGLRDARRIARKPQGAFPGRHWNYNTVTPHEDRRIKALPRICFRPPLRRFDLAVLR